MPSVRPVDALPTAQLPRGEVDAAHGALVMADLWSMTLADVRSAFSEVIVVYLTAMQDTTHGIEHRLAAAKLAQQELNDYLKLLSQTELEVELRQMQRLLAD
jgi:hypothetical protein